MIKNNWLTQLISKNALDLSKFQEEWIFKVDDFIKMSPKQRKETLDKALKSDKSTPLGGAVKKVIESKSLTAQEIDYILDYAIKEKIWPLDNVLKMLEPVLSKEQKDKLKEAISKK